MNHPFLEATGLNPEQFYQKYPSKEHFFNDYPSFRNGGMYQDGGQTDPMTAKVQELLAQGTPPDQVVQMLIEQGVPQDKAVQLVNSLASQPYTSHGEEYQPNMKNGGNIPIFQPGGPFSYANPDTWDNTQMDIATNTPTPQPQTELKNPTNNFKYQQPTIPTEHPFNLGTNKTQPKTKDITGRIFNLDTGALNGNPKDIAKAAVEGTNMITAGLLDFGVNWTNTDKNSPQSAIKRFNLKNSNPMNTFAQVQGGKGISYAQNGGNFVPNSDNELNSTVQNLGRVPGQGIDSVFSTIGHLSPLSISHSIFTGATKTDDPVRLNAALKMFTGNGFKNGGKVSMLTEGQELDLTSEEIHKLEQQGYKFQLL